MPPLPTEEDMKKEETLFRRPAGVLLDEIQWLYLKKRYNMTPRELQVAILVCRGFSNDEIAKALKIRHGTVKTHLRNIYRRTRVKSKVLLLLRFVEDISKSYVPPKPASSTANVTEEMPKTETASKPSPKK